MSESTERNLRIAIASVATALTLIAYYALDRSRAAIFDPGPDPSIVIASERVEYFWRVTICAYAAPLVFAGWYALARGREHALWHRVSWAIVPVSVIAAALSVIFP